MFRRTFLATGVALAMTAAGMTRAESSADSGVRPNARPLPSRTLQFSGRTWIVRTIAGKSGPGPNWWSSSANNVWVDDLGRLHLKITKDRNRWSCAEIMTAESLGYGTYRFYLDSPVDNLDPNAVLGLFTWNDAPEYNHREIDIEFARWGAPGNQNAQYVVQPYTIPANILRWDEPAGLPQTTHSFNWLPGSVEFQSLKGLLAEPAGPGDIIRQWTLTGASPVEGGENARMNLWLFEGHAPADGKEVEVIVNSFEFVPG